VKHNGVTRIADKKPVTPSVTVMLREKERCSAGVKSCLYSKNSRGKFVCDYLIAQITVRLYISVIYYSESNTEEKIIKRIKCRVSFIQSSLAHRAAQCHIFLQQRQLDPSNQTLVQQ
jgi:hypothetical protein